MSSPPLTPSFSPKSHRPHNPNSSHVQTRTQECVRTADCVTTIQKTATRCVSLCGISMWRMQDLRQRVFETKWGWADFNPRKRERWCNGTIMIGMVCHGNPHHSYYSSSSCSSSSSSQEVFTELTARHVARAVLPSPSTPVAPQLVFLSATVVRLC
jgi:hypothetical protein